MDEALLKARRALSEYTRKQRADDNAELEEACGSVIARLRAAEASIVELRARLERMEPKP